MGIQIQVKNSEFNTYGIARKALSLKFAESDQVVYSLLYKRENNGDSRPKAATAITHRFPAHPG